MMELTLYHYVHCPFCIRVRMGLGYLGLSYKSNVVPYDDEATPIGLTGVKMLPIMEINGRAMNESLDILASIDSQNLLKVKAVTSSLEYKKFNDLLDKLAKNVHNLAMPYWIYTPEFNASSRTYFQKKKEVKRGPFKDLVKKHMDFERAILKDLLELSDELKPFYRSEHFTLYDILLAAHLWGLYVVPEFQFPPAIHAYLQKVKETCRFDYHEDFWR